MVTCAQVGTVKPNPHFHGHTSHISPLPKSHVVALSDFNWRDAMYDEYSALIRNSIWILVPKPPNANVVQSMWLFRHKYHVDGSLSIYKARLVANGPPRSWFQRFAGYALRVGFSSSRSDSSLFIYQHGSEVVYLLIYVDDIVLTTSSTYLLQRITSSLHKEFGGLQYLTFTRPDISYVVQQVCLYMHDPREPYFSALKRILRYVRGTLDFGLQLYASSTSYLMAYTDADWAGCPTTRRSTSGYCVFLGDNLLSWSCKRQHTLFRSSVDAEYQCVANVVAETAWLCNLLRELHMPLSSATLVYCDNVSAIYLTANPVQH
ncbi:ribonuclease H-like domain-containing protein [Tanacetum coccineum]